MKACLSLLAVFLVVSPLVLGDGGDAPAKFKITTKKTDDGVEVRADKGKTMFIVKSPSGISQAVIERTGEK